MLPSSRRGLPDILVAACVSAFSVFSVPRLPSGVVETRRLELLTLSLQRRCSSRLSYVPIPTGSAAAVDGGRFWTRTRDLCLIRAVL